MNSKIDRRSRERVAANLPVRVRANVPEAELSAQTRDVSTNGIFLYTQSRMEEGSDVELILILPPELTSGEKCWVCCHARIVRVEQGSGHDFGVAAEIRRMDVLPELPA
jgi:c-di-GMP-binding flagellar brake protein YcgR